MSIVTGKDIDNILILLKKGEYSVVLTKLLEIAKNGHAALVHLHLNAYGRHFNACIFYEIDGWIYSQMGDRESALESYKKSYKLMPAKESLIEIFNCYYLTGKYEKALSIAKKIVKEYGNSCKILVVKTQLKLLDIDGQLRLIEECLAEIKSFENPFVEEHLALKGATICYDLGLYNKALELVQRSIASCYKHKPGPEHFQTLEMIEKKIK